MVGAYGGNPGLRPPPAKRTDRSMPEANFVPRLHLRPSAACIHENFDARRLRNMSRFEQTGESKTASAALGERIPLTATA